MSTPRRAWEAAGGGLVWGVVCGLLLGTTEALYLVGVLIAILGGIAGGAQHADLRGAVLRGLAGGTAFGLGILAGFELGGGGEPAVELPDPRIGLLVLTIGPAPFLSALGWWLG